MYLITHYTLRNVALLPVTNFPPQFSFLSSSSCQDETVNLLRLVFRFFLLTLVTSSPTPTSTLLESLHVLTFYLPVYLVKACLDSRGYLV